MTPAIETDLAIVGSGFAGSLVALIARSLGYSVALIERGKHPRIVIGESTTPLTNLLLEELCERYRLPEIRTFSKWGTWQRSHPDVACGLKRGFSFFHHSVDGTGVPYKPSSGWGGLADRDRQLLVAASPHDAIADTHWYRADFDHFLVQAAQRSGAEYFDHALLDAAADSSDGILLHGTRHGQLIAFRARFVIDATGPRGFLHRALKLGESALPGLPPTQALFSHFSGAGKLADRFDLNESPPYPIDDAAVHHLFPGGWVWVLQFNNGITSAGVACTDEAAADLGFAARSSNPADDEARYTAAWERLLDRLPVLQQQFASAKPIRPFTHIPRLSFRSAQIAGRNWALLPSAAGFVDPLLSTGFPLTLLGIQRLAAMLEAGLDAPNREGQLADYASQTDAELLAAADLVGALYASLDNFPVFVALTMVYFAAVSYAESAHRLGKPELASSFLLVDHPDFGPSMRALIARSRNVRSNEEAAQFADDVRRAIEPINIAGLADPARRNWYPVDASDLLGSAQKLHATRDEIAKLLDRCGFHPQATIPD